MIKLFSTSLCLRYQQIRCLHYFCFLNVRFCSTSGENQLTVKALYNLSVDIQKIRQLKGWVLYQTPAHVNEAANLLSDLGASGPVIARVLELFPEAVLCSPEQMVAQRDLWRSICPNQRELVGIIEKFPSSFFTSASHHTNQKENIILFQSLHLNKRIITKLMASAPQSFSRPMRQNEQMVSTLQRTFLELGGNEDNMKIWLQKLLSQNPFVLVKSPTVLRENLIFLRDRAFTTAELLQLLSKLKGFVTELSPENMRNTLAYSQQKMGCSEAKLRTIVLNCPALLYYPQAVLADRFDALLRAGVSIPQIIETPTVLELTTQIVNYRIQRLQSSGHDVRTGSLQALSGTKKDFEESYGKLLVHKVKRPLFNPVAPLSTDD